MRVMVSAAQLGRGGFRVEAIFVIHMLFGTALGLTVRAPAVIVASILALCVCPLWLPLAPLGLVERLACVFGCLVLLQAGYIWASAAISEATDRRPVRARR